MKIMLNCYELHEGTMAAVNWTQQVGILTLHLNFDRVLWNSWQRGREAWDHRPQRMFASLILDAGKRLMVTNCKLTHWGPAWQVSSRDINISCLLLIHLIVMCHPNELTVVQLKQGTAYKLSNNMRTESQTVHVYECNYLNRRLLYAWLANQ